MIRKNFISLICLISLMGTSLVSCGGGANKFTGNEDYKTVGEKIEDKKVVQLVSAKFKAHADIPHHLIHLSIDRGIVQLSGFVHTPQEADLAVLTAGGVNGVKDVINDIKVLSDASYALLRARAEARNTQR